MSPDLFYKKFIQNMKELYPSSLISEKNIKNGVSPFTIALPLSILKDIKKTVKNIYLWSQHHSIINNDPPISRIPIKNHSVLMSYDFHLTPDHQLKLIEINTNASGFLVTDMIQKTHNRQTDALNELKNSFFNEWNLFSSPSNKNTYPDPYTQSLNHLNINKKSTVFSRPVFPKKTVIIDENIETQNMKYEFFMYHDLMNSWNWKNEVLDVKKIHLHPNGKLLDSQKNEIDFAYNRLTDFYFEKWENMHLAYKKQKTCFSPNPKSYAVLADKKNLCFLTYFISNPTDINVDYKFLKQIISKTYFLEPKNKEILSSSKYEIKKSDVYISKEYAWKNKKQLFFKPLRSYGGKSAYRGSSITKTKMALLENCVAQEYAPSLNWEDPVLQDKWKFDIRAYVYRDKVQLIGIRIYKGQLTNFSNLFSGFGNVLFK